MIDLYSDIANSDSAIYLSYEASAALRILIYVGLEIIFHKIKERYPKIKTVVYLLRTVAIINFAWVCLDYIEFKTHIPVKTGIINYFVK